MAGKSKLYKDHPLKDFTSYKIGGPAERLYIPQTKYELAKIVEDIRKGKKSPSIIGGGTNVLISDNGLEGSVILTTECCKFIEKSGDVIICGSSVLLSDLISFTIDNGLGGLENLAGIPGTVGGAIMMNAGAYGSEISNYLSKVTLINEYGKITELAKEEIRFAYRTAPGLIGKTVISGYFRFDPADKGENEKKVNEIIAVRKSKQPWDQPSAGSVFKRHPLGAAGYLIEGAGLKGFRIGDAQISEKHANFIVNRGNARAIEVLALIRKTQEIVFSKHYAELELEQRLLGFTENELENPDKHL